MFLNWLRRVPNAHDRVADILINGPVGFSLDDTRELLEVETEHVGQLIRSESFGDGGEAFDVAKHYRNLQKFSAEGRFLLVAVELPDKIDGRVLAHRSHCRFRLLQALQHLTHVPEYGGCLRGREIESIHLQAFPSDLLLERLMLRKMAIAPADSSSMTTDSAASM